MRALARGEEEQRPCSVSREDALALFTQVSDAVFPLFAQVLNGQRPVLKVRQMKTRWGVCVPAKRQITFSLRLAEKPRAAVEYVVLHEYAHFVRADHSPAFWAVVARYMPDYKARRRAAGAVCARRNGKPGGTAAYILKRKNGALFAVLVLPAQGRGFKMAGYMIYYYS